MRQNTQNSTKTPRKLEIVETIDRLEKKHGKPDIETLAKELSKKHGRKYTTQEIKEQIEFLKKSPSSHKIVNQSLIRDKLSLTTYGQQLLN